MNRSVLVVCNGGGIGDAFLATPVMRALRMRFERVVAFTTRGQAAAISGSAADEVWYDDGKFFPLVKRLRDARFDAAVVTWATARTAYALALAYIPQRIGQARRLYSPLFTARVTLPSELGDRTTRWAQQLLEYARVLGCDGDDQPISIVDDDARREAGQLLCELGIDSEPFILFHSTRGISRERVGWPAASMACVAAALRERYNCSVLLSGSPAERGLIAGIAARAEATSIAGKTTLPVFAAVAERAKLIVAMDSGPMHLAAATGAPTLGIFAMQPDEPDRWYPIGPRTAVVRPAYPCPPRHTKERCPGFTCVRELDPARVIAAADGLLGSEPEEQCLCTRPH